MIIPSGIAGGMCEGFSSCLNRGWKAAPTSCFITLVQPRGSGFPAASKIDPILNLK